MRKLCFIIIITIASLISGNISAFDNEITHRILTGEAIENSKVKINKYLEKNMNLPIGVNTLLKGKLNLPNGAVKPVEWPIKKWLMEGSFLEDVPNCRASNHFHNPLREWTESGMRDQPWFIDWWCSEGLYPPENIKSAVHWATGYTAPSPGGAKVNTGNAWDWDYAREYYYTYLTGKDFQGNVVASSQDQREEYFAESLQSLGQVLHVLQDMAVPAHVRDDFKSHLEWFGITLETLFSPNEWIGEKFEYYVKKHSELIYGAEGGELTEPSLTKFWDTNNYTGQDPDGLNSLITGLAEYTNMNFASKNTIFAEDFLNDSYIDGGMLPKTVSAEDNMPDTSFWIEKTGDGEILTYFVKPTYFTGEILIEPDYEVTLLYWTFKIDEVCCKKYASKLLPKAVGYSAGLLDYFFRGKMDVTSLPIFLDEGTDTNLHFLRLKVKNMTESEETMSDGTYNLIFRYRDGDEEKTVQAVDVSSGELQYGDETEIDFELPFWPGADKISLEEYQSGVTCTLVFRGKLGNEMDAVVGKVFTLGEEVKFEEAWDNELDGNHPWTHSTAAQNPPNGETVNEVQDGILLKENKRYVGHSTPRNNESFLYIPGSGVTITPNTYVEFKIDELSVQERPPDGEHWHVLMLYFNNGDLNIQFSYDGQFGDLGWTNVAYCLFTPGSITIGNIHQIFDYVGIEIPDPLYLTWVGFGQQLYELYEPSTAEHRQRTRVDFIRIIDAKEEQQE